MTGETIEISTPDGIAEAYVARPDAGDHPGVLFYIDAIGLRPSIEEMADRIASWGYVVLAPNVFYREGTAEELAPTTDLTVAEHREAFFAGGVMARVARHTAAQARVDLDAYVTALQTHSGMTGDLGVTGYCMGGRLALRAAASRPDVVAAAAAFHTGGLVTDAPDSVHRVLQGARAEIVAGHADNDGSNTPEQIVALDVALAAAGLTFTTAVYAGALHGYTMSDTSAFDAAAFERHFQELEDLFDRTLRPPVA